MRRFAFVTVCALLLNLAPLAYANAQDATAKSELSATITNTRADKGRVGCSLFDERNADAFPRNTDKSIRQMWSPIHAGTAVCGFKDVPPGTYAIVVFQDEDLTGKMRNNFIGMPQEGFGFSQNPVVRLSAPTFTDASFKYDGNHQNLPIQLQYYGGK
ncbi:MAG TPA: DUF2141 domain-containing protein [Candidatus Binataceae bacterium]|nr:DUF2141 domain-containing protein [Candidatus Binataceae bacterium]